MPMTGIFFPNDNKYNDKAPNMKGRITVSKGAAQEMFEALKASGGADVEFEIAGWNRQGQKGPFMSLKIGPMQQRQERPQSFQRQPSAPPPGQFRQPRQEAPPPQLFQSTPFDEPGPEEVPPWA